MKDYYKILGVKDTASMDEIRDRWLELVREFHPDQGKEVNPENEEKVREINEAYQVLKHSSTRVEYDLRKAFEKRESSFKKWFLPVAAALVLMIGGAGVIYFTHPDDSSVSAPIFSTTEASDSAIQNGSVRQDASGKELPRSVKSEPPAEPERIAAPQEGTNPPDKTANAPQVQQAQANKSGAGFPSRASVLQVSKASVNPGRQLQQETGGRVTPETAREATETIPTTIEKETAGAASSAASEETPAAAGTPPRGAASFIAEEGEIRQFLADYKHRYTQKDPIAFMRLFSSAAVQNQKQKMDDIRYIYQTFFDQSEDLQYDMEETSIEIYQNAAEVKARFRINQTLKKNGEKRLWKGPIRWVLVKEDAALKIGMLDYQLTK